MNVKVQSLVVLAGLLAVACGGTDAAFEAAQRSNTQAAWEDYLRQHPQGEHARAARELLAQLVEAREWERARSADTIAAYQEYLRGYPQGPHAHDASTAVANLSLAAAPAVEASAPPTRAAAKAGKPAAGAKGQPARAARAAPATATPVAAARSTTQGFRAQLGAFAKGSAAASAAWQALVARYPELHEREPIITAAHSADGRAIHRLQVGGFDRAAAEALCQKLTAGHDACLVIWPTPDPARRSPHPA